MSTIIASNISDGTTSVPSTYVVNGSAKAWVNFNGTGTVAIRDSFNVSSLTDVSTGRTLTNFTNNMSNENYSVTSLDWTWGVGWFNSPQVQFADITRANSSFQELDVAIVTVTINGDLA